MSPTRSGDGLAVKLSSRGAAFDDLDNDGDVDVVILNSRREPTILRNDSPGGNHWIRVRPRGTRGNRNGIGARITVTAGGRIECRRSPQRPWLPKPLRDRTPLRPGLARAG